jgi:hypothetical protein
MVGLGALVAGEIEPDDFITLDEAMAPPHGATDHQ